MPEILGKQIGAVGYGLMGKSPWVLLNVSPLFLWLLTVKTGFTWRPQPIPEEQAFEAMRTALANGSNFVRGPQDKYFQLQNASRAQGGKNLEKSPRRNQVG